MTMEHSAVTEPVLEIIKVIDAPREQVFRAWTEAEHLKHWWGPVGMELSVIKLDVRPGGEFHYGMKAPTGFEMFGKFVYHEVAAPERLVYASSFADSEGNIIRAPFSEEFPLRVLNTLTLTEHNGKTTITLRGTPLDATETERAFFAGMFDSMQKGFGGTFEQLENYLAADRQIVLSRVFDAPRDLVFKAWTDPVHIAQWFGPNGFTLTTHEMDVRPGGVWRFILHGPDGVDYPNMIMYTAVEAPERLTYAQNGDDGYEPHFHVTVTFAEQGAKTELTMRMTFPTAWALNQTEARYGAIEGGKQTLARLAEHVAAMQG